MRCGVKYHIGSHNYVQVDYSHTENLRILIQHFFKETKQIT